MTQPLENPSTRSPLQALSFRLSQVAIAISATALAGLVLVQGWQVIARYVLNDSPSWTEPVTVLLLSTAMSLGAAAGVHDRRHFGFFLLMDAASPRVGRGLQALSGAVIATLGAVIATWSVRLLLDGLSIKMAGAMLPQSINYLPLALGASLMVLFALTQLVTLFSAPSTQGAA